MMRTAIVAGAQRCGRTVSVGQTAGFGWLQLRRAGTDVGTRTSGGLRSNTKRRRPAGADEFDRGLPLESRQFIREVEDAHRAAQTSSRGGGGIPAAAASSDPQLPEVGPATVSLLRHDTSALFTNRLGTLALHDHRRPQSVNVTAGEDRRPIAARDEQCLQLEARIASVVESTSMPLLERGRLLADCLAEAVDKDLELRASTCDAMIGLWCASMDPQVPMPTETTAAAIEQTLLLPSSSSGLERSNHPTPLTATGVTQQGGGSLSDWPFYEHVVRLYYLMRGNFVSPLPSTVENVMLATSVQSALHGKSDRRFQLALLLLDDCDRHCVLPSRVALTSFIDVCAFNGHMEAAVRRIGDAKHVYFIAPDSQMCTAVLRGFARNNMIHEAVLFLSCLDAVPVDANFLNAALEPLSLSDEPQSAFAAYRAACESSSLLRPTSETYRHLLVACQRMQHWEQTNFILAEMQRFRVRGSPETLNLLAKGLLIAGYRDYARVLFSAMRAKAIPLWPEVDEAAQTVLGAPRTPSDSLTTTAANPGGDNGASGRRAAARPQNKHHDSKHARILDNSHKRSRSRSTSAAGREPSADIEKFAREGRLDKLPARELGRALLVRGAMTVAELDALVERRGHRHARQHLARRLHKELFGVWPAAAAASHAARGRGAFGPRRTAPTTVTP